MAAYGRAGLLLYINIHLSPEKLTRGGGLVGVKYGWSEGWRRRCVGLPTISHTLVWSKIIPHYCTYIGVLVGPHIGLPTKSHSLVWSDHKIIPYYCTHIGVLVGPQYHTTISH